MVLDLVLRIETVSGDPGVVLALGQVSHGVIGVGDAVCGAVDAFVDLDQPVVVVIVVMGDLAFAVGGGDQPGRASSYTLVMAPSGEGMVMVVGIPRAP